MLTTGIVYPTQRAQTASITSSGVPFVALRGFVADEKDPNSSAALRESPGRMTVRFQCSAIRLAYIVRLRLFCYMVSAAGYTDTQYTFRVPSIWVGCTPSALQGFPSVIRVGLTYFVRIFPGAWGEEKVREAAPPVVASLQCSPRM